MEQRVVRAKELLWVMVGQRRAQWTVSAWLADEGRGYYNDNDDSLDGR